MENDDRERSARRAALRDLAERAGISLADDEAALVRKMTALLPPMPPEVAVAALRETLHHKEGGVRV